MSGTPNAESVSPVCQVVVVRGRWLEAKCGHLLPCPEHATTRALARQHYDKTGHGFQWVSQFSARCNRCPLRILVTPDGRQIDGSVSGGEPTA